jgi:hypothetical protein
MTKKMLLVVATMLIAVSSLSAQTPAQPAASSNWGPISACFGMAIASGLCG